MYEERTVLLAPTNWLWGGFHKVRWPKDNYESSPTQNLSLLKTPRFSVGVIIIIVILLTGALWFSSASNVSQNQTIGCWLGLIIFAWTCQWSAFSYIYASLWNLLPDVFFFFFYFPSVLGAHTFGHAGLELMVILLSQPPKCWHGFMNYT